MEARKAAAVGAGEPSVTSGESAVTAAVLRPGRQSRERDHNRERRQTLHAVILRPLPLRGWLEMKSSRRGPILFALTVPGGEKDGAPGARVGSINDHAKD
jgi:hypothetical protein